MNRANCVALSLLWWMSTALVAALDSPSPVPSTIDWRQTIETNEWTSAGPGQWLTRRVKAGLAFNELIYYWNARLPRDQGFRLYLQAEFGREDLSPWLYGGYWGTVKPSGQRVKPTFDRGLLDEDTLLLKSKAVAFRFKVVDEGDVPLTVLPRLGVVVSDTSPGSPAALSASAAGQSRTPSKILDVPLRLQVDVCGNSFPDRCQSAALASAMQYFGKTVPLEQIIGYTTDPEYRTFGIWPRTINAAVEHGFDAYLERFRDWEAVRRTVAQNKVILCSITMPPATNYVAPPYPEMSGHIVALCGVTDDGRVVVTDSARSAQRAQEGGHCLQWLVADFERIWMQNKGGVGMVICPPRNAAEHLVTDLPPYPRPIPPR